MSGVKRRCLSLSEKLKIIELLENGKSNADICKEFRLSSSSVSTIWSQRIKISEAVSSNRNSKLKRLRPPRRPDVDKALLKWFSTQRSLNVPVSGPLMQAKAESFGNLLSSASSSTGAISDSIPKSDKNFICTTGWVDRFKRRYNIKAGKMHGESKSVDSGVTDLWLKTVWPNILKRYHENDIFNGDETGLFYKLTPDKTLKFKGEKCSGGKLSKERITVWVCANMSGSEKRKLLVIGKAKSPRCFKNCNNLPVKYEANRRAWMTSELFEAELQSWNQYLSRKKRKIALLIDNCPAHPKLTNLSNIELIFLPPNVTSILQPMDQGVIRCLKSHYRKLLLFRLINSIDRKEDFTVSVLDAIIMTSSAWNRVSQRTIRNCFRHAGFDNDNGYDSEDDLPLAEWLKTVNQDEDNLPLSQWVTRNGINEFSCSDLDAYVEIDCEVITNDIPSDNDIVETALDDQAEISNEQHNMDNSDDKVDVPTLSYALKGLETLQKYVACIADNVGAVQACEVLNRRLQQDFLRRKNQKQTLISDYIGTK